MKTMQPVQIGFAIMSAIARKALQTLKSLKLIEKDHNSERRMSSQGRPNCRFKRNKRL